MFDGFKKFIARGNMVDMAVGVVMGGAVTAVVTAIVEGVINPFIAMIFGKPNMDNLLAFTFNGATVSFGKVLTSLINFLIIAVAVYFCIVMPINKLRDITERQMAKLRGDKGDVAAEEPAISPEEQTVILLQEIRDSLAAQQTAPADVPSAVQNAVKPIEK
ncbi:large conductance mechanosensitive channel protein MscL [Bifidobacterium magnum]|uniref:Large-conductance mechanosensitive channel n=1 Tax=Bifidobacterium magnum TaxID=1692 RepID=A0A087B7Z1_9BIFI|nr:large conductance mechanosensitive channel protein MscL [Bifidobacterium magnum]KFI67141.1 Large-conductance mechanosensitive channel, MscL [Bifidobacterium magnum]